MEENNPKKINIFIPDKVFEGSMSIILDTLRVSKAGYYVELGEHYAKRHCFNEFQLIYCVKGKGFFNMNGIERQIKEGDVTACYKGLDHEYGADPGDPWTILWIHFDGKAALELLGNIGFTPEKPVIQLSDRIQLIPHFMEILYTLKSGYHPGNLLYASVCFQHILAILAKDAQSRRSLQGNITINNIIEFMTSNVFKVISLEQMAGEAKMSKSNFCRVFHANIGYAPMNYFIRLKMQKACELLESTTLRSKEIAEKLGYEDEYYFSRLFKKITGYAPRAYRKKSLTR